MGNLDLGRTDLVKHHIELTDYTPIKDRYMSQLQAGGPVIPGLTSSGQGQTQSEHALGCYGNLFTTVMNTISTLWAGTHEPHRKVAGLVVSVLVITSLRAI